MNFNLNKIYINTNPKGCYGLIKQNFSWDVGTFCVVQINESDYYGIAIYCWPNPGFCYEKIEDIKKLDDLVAQGTLKEQVMDFNQIQDDIKTGIGFIMYDYEEYVTFYNKKSIHMPQLVPPNQWRPTGSFHFTPFNEIFLKNFDLLWRAYTGKEGDDSGPFVTDPAYMKKLAVLAAEERSIDWSEEGIRQDQYI